MLCNTYETLDNNVNAVCSKKSCGEARVQSC